MSTLYPGALDTGTSLPNPSSSNAPNSPSHAGLHTSENGAIIATQTKVGTGASTPVANTLLFGTGTGTSAWTALTSANLAATVSDETGSGSLVFATTPTLITPKVDTINENTLNNGVTIAGVSIKSGVIQGTPLANNAVLNANVADAAITPAKLFAGTGTTWPYQSYTPTFANTTLGNGTVTGKYSQIGKLVNFKARFTLGSSSAMGSTPTVTLPVTAQTLISSGTTNGDPLGTASLYDSSASSVWAALIYATSTSVAIIYTWGTTPQTSGIASSTPFTWAVGDQMIVSGTYEAA